MFPTLTKFQFRPLPLSIIALSSVIILSACGGGGGGSGGSGGGSSAASLSTIPWVVDAAAARQAISGSSAPTKTVAQAEQEIRAIEDATNETVISDILAFGSTAAVRFPTSCSGLVCTVDVLGESHAVDLSQTPDPSNDISQLQLVMEHNGVSIGQSRERSDPGTEDQLEIRAYGGWMQYSGFSVEFSADPTVASPEIVMGISGSYGNSSGTNPSDLSGRTATWTGAVVGADYYLSHVIHGTATVDVDFAKSDVDVSFSELVDLDDRTRSIADMSWSDIPVSNGKFSQGSGADQIEGQFYGPNHEEVGGIFERNQILGAFGAIRGTQ